MPVGVSDGLDQLWPTPLLSIELPGANDALNPELLKLAYSHRRSAHAEDTIPYASEDDLLQRYREGPVHDLFAGLSNAVFEAARAVNAGAWSRLGAPRIRVEIVGAWFQIANKGAFHDVHNHGNCSWSGVYYVQVDATAQRVRNTRFGVDNGVTRFYGPYLNRLGGAHMDLGSAYLQHSHVDVPPIPGRAVIFPSHLLHKAMPYEGELDRVIFSFNAQLHGASGDRTETFGF